MLLGLSMDYNVMTQHDKPIYTSLSSEFYIKSSRFVLIKILVTTLVLLVIFSVYYYVYIEQYDLTRITSKWSLLYRQQEPVDVLILGDSVALSGINPDKIELETGLKALNLALNGRWVYEHDIWALEYYIDQFGPPKFIIWGHTYEVPAMKFNAVERFTSSTYPYEFAMSSQYLQPTVTDQENNTIRIGRLFPLYFRDKTTETIVSTLLALKNPIKAWDSDYKGFSQHDPTDTEVVEKRIQQETKNLRERYDVHKLNRITLDALFNMVEQYEIPTYAVITPVHHTIGLNEKFVDAIKAQRRYLYEQSRQFDMVFYNPEIPIFDTEFMFDGHHLNVNGAEIYTQYLTDWIWGDYVPATLAEIETLEDTP